MSGPACKTGKPQEGGELTHCREVGCADGHAAQVNEQYMTKADGGYQLSVYRCRYQAYWTAIRLWSLS